MRYRTYRLWKALVVIAVAVLVGWAVPTGNAFVPIPVAIAGMAVLFIIRRGVREVVVDERTYNIANQASRLAFQIVTLMMVLIGVTLVSLGYGEYPEVELVGFALIYSACGFLLVYFLSYVYFSRKLGGKS
jgi:uncharacterized membrane protein